MVPRRVDTRDIPCQENAQHFTTSRSYSGQQRPELFMQWSINYIISSHGLSVAGLFVDHVRVPLPHYSALQVTSHITSCHNYKHFIADERSENSKCSRAPPSPLNPAPAWQPTWRLLSLNPTENIPEAGAAARSESGITFGIICLSL